MKFVLISNFLLFLLFLPLSAVASGAVYCLYKTTEQKAKINYSIDYDLENAIDRAGWTWINLDWNGDDYSPDFIQSPDKTSITKFPELYYKTCSYWQKSWGGCRIATSVFSPATKIAFIDGNEISFLGMESPKSYAVYGDKIIELPSSFWKAAKYRGDANSIGYAALRGLEEELLLFNGENTVSITIPEAKPRDDGYPSWGVSNDLATNRSFVHTNAFMDSEIFLYEIVEGAKIKKIDLDPNMKGWIMILSEPDTKQMWIIDRYGIYAEVGNSFKRVIHLPASDYIYGPANTGYTDKGDFYFEIVRDGDKKESFFLKPQASDCFAQIDLNTDQILDNK